MRLAAVADIHGNLPALEAVVSDLQGREVDLVVDLGDLLSGFVQPAETADRLMELGWPTVSGNHERQVLTTPLDELSASDRLARESTTSRHRDWLRTLPSTLELPGGGLAFHGSPEDDLCYLLETVQEQGLRRATVAEVVRRLGEHAARPLLLCGHTHLQRSMVLPAGGLVVNPGSVGWPAYQDDEPLPHVVEAGTPHARYAVVDDASGTWQVEMIRIGYDWDRAASFAEDHDRRDVAHALRTGTLTT